MDKRNMTQKELNEKMALLKDGQVVQIAGDFFRACKVAEAWEGRACEACNLDSICRGDVELVCSELDKPFYSRYYLKLAHP
jgi:hypothetical protein